MGILLFILKYIFISLLLKMINGFSWLANIMASPFNNPHQEYHTQYLMIKILNATPAVCC